jgi:hypothetical protein
MAGPPVCTSFPSAAAPVPCVYAFGAPTYLRFDLTPLAAAFQRCTLPGEPSFSYALALCASLPPDAAGA